MISNFFLGAPKKNTSHGNEVLLQDTTHLIQRPCYQRGSPCQDPAGNWTTRRPPDYRQETQTAVVWSCLPFIRSGQNPLARHSEREKKTRQTEKEVGRQHQGMDEPGVRQVPKDSGEQRKMEKLVAKSSVVPQRHSRLRDRWWWWSKILIVFFNTFDSVPPTHLVMFFRLSSLQWTGGKVSRLLVTIICGPQH